MARPLRIEYPGALYHVTSRGNMRESIFFDEADKKTFLEILTRTKERYSYLLYAYALMDNHYHLLIETPLANLSQIMQNINTSYTVYVNRKYSRSGHLLQGRYKALIIDKDNYLIELSRYIHLNPVRAKVALSPLHYKWTSYRTYVSSTEDTLVDVDKVLPYFSPKRREAKRKYIEFVESALKSDYVSPLDKLRAGIVLGEEAFVERIRSLLRGYSSTQELPQIKRLNQKVEIQNIISRLAGFYKRSQDHFTGRGKGKEERKIAIYLAKTLGCLKNEEIGRYFNIKTAAVSIVLKNMEKELIHSSKLRRKMEMLKGVIGEN